MADDGAIKLICLDLDGTAMDTDGEHRWLADEIVALLNAAGRRGVAWCTNSGRSYANQLGIVQACRTLEHMPVALLSGERFIHWLKPRFAPHEPFNSEMKARMLDLHPRVTAALAPHLALLNETYTFDYTQDSEQVIGWNLTEREQVRELQADLERILAEVSDAQVLCNGTWVIITHTAAGKGVILSEAAKHLRIARENILAVGDHLNDVDMLDGRSASMVGCPADADAEVRSLVASAGGMVALSAASAGTAEIIRHMLRL